MRLNMIFIELKKSVFLFFQLNRSNALFLLATLNWQKFNADAQP